MEGTVDGWVCKRMDGRALARTQKYVFPITPYLKKNIYIYNKIKIKLKINKKYSHYHDRTA